MLTRPFTVADVWPLGKRMRIFAIVSVVITPISAVAKIVSKVLCILSSKPERVDFAELVSKVAAFSLFSRKKLNYTTNANTLF